MTTLPQLREEIERNRKYLCGPDDAMWRMLDLLEKALGMNSMLIETIRSIKMVIDSPSGDEMDSLVRIDCLAESALKLSAEGIDLRKEIEK